MLTRLLMTGIEQIREKEKESAKISKDPEPTNTEYDANEEEYVTGCNVCVWGGERGGY